MSMDKNIFDKKYINDSEKGLENYSYTSLRPGILSKQLDKPIDIDTVTHGKDSNENPKPQYGSSKPYRKIIRGKVTVDKS